MILHSLPQVSTITSPAGFSYRAEKVGPCWPLRVVPWGVATLRQPISNHYPPATALTYLIFVLFLDSLIALIELLFRLSTLFMLLTED